MTDHASDSGPVDAIRRYFEEGRSSWKGSARDARGAPDRTSAPSRPLAHSASEGERTRRSRVRPLPSQRRVVLPLHRRQLVIDISGELSSRSGHAFEDYTRAVRNLSRIEAFRPELVEELARLPGFRNVLVPEYVGLDFELVMRELENLDPIEEFARIVAAIPEL